jgi:hypothetical protein
MWIHDGGLITRSALENEARIAFAVIESYDAGSRDPTDK